MNNFFEKVSNIFLRKNSNGKGINLSRIKNPPAVKFQLGDFARYRGDYSSSMGFRLGLKISLQPVAS